MVRQKDKGVHVKCMCWKREMGQTDSFGRTKNSQSLWCKKIKKKEEKVCREFLKYSGNEDRVGR